MVRHRRHRRSARRGSLRGQDPLGRLAGASDQEPFAGGDPLRDRGGRPNPPHARGFHPMGAADPSGFAAMACDEILVHTHDAGTGLEADFRPSAALAARVLTRLFPWHEPGDDPWTTLLWANGRLDLPGAPGRDAGGGTAPHSPNGTAPYRSPLDEDRGRTGARRVPHKAGVVRTRRSETTEVGPLSRDPPHPIRHVRALAWPAGRDAA